MYAGYAVHRQVPRKDVGARLRRGQCSEVLEFGEHKADAATRNAGPVMSRLNICGRDRASFGNDLGFDIFDDGQRLRRGEMGTDDGRRVPPEFDPNEPSDFFKLQSVALDRPTMAFAASP